MYHGLNLLRGLAAFGIVGCHLGLSPCTSGGTWVTALCNFNVGLFAAISGFLMNTGKNIDFVAYVGKRVMRILPTYFVWSLVYIVATAGFDIMFDGGRLNERFYDLSNWAWVIFGGSAATHLWFLICLFYAQLILCAINYALDRSFSSQRWKNVVLSISSVALLVCSVSFLNWWCIYPVRLMAFLILGYILKSLISPDVFYLPLVTVVLMLAMHLSMHSVLPGFVRDYLLAISVVILFVSDKFKQCNFATLLAVTSMGVYLIHPLFARGVSFIVGRIFSPPYDALVVACVWVAVWGMSFVACLGLRRFTFVSKFLA